MSGPTTTYGNPKEWSWSYSKLKNFEVCPKRHFHIDLARDVKEEESDNLIYGNLLHEHMAKYVDKGIALPAGTTGDFPPYNSPVNQKWADIVKNAPGRTLVEQKYAITRAHEPRKYFDRDVWYRGIGDVVKLNGPVGLIIDWKTGKIVEDSVQLALMAQCMFSHYPELQAVRAEFVWLKEDATTRQNFKRTDMVGLWNSLMPRVNTLEASSKAMNYPPKPGHLCRKWCPVTQCPHQGV